MWIFGFGSLMTDRWEAKFGCSRREVAELAGYRRVFNKLSVKNWGTRDCPCPTLSLEVDAEATCVGVAFEFDDSKVAEVNAYLDEREGSGFHPQRVTATLRDGHIVNVNVWIYEGKYVSEIKEPETLAHAVRHAAGSSGRCYDYVQGIYLQLAEVGIDDPAVTKLWRAVSFDDAEPGSPG